MKAEHSILTLCQYLEVSPSGYYDWQRRRTAPGPRALENQTLTKEIQAIHARSRQTYGSPRILVELRKQGHSYGRNRIARIMHATGLCGRQKGRYRVRTTDSNHDEPIAPNRLATAPKLAAEYVRLVEQNAAAVVVSQTWSEVHRVNSRVREALKGKGLLGATDTVVQVLDKLDLTNAQKRDARFYPPNAIVIFNQKVSVAQPGAQGKLAGIVKVGVLIEVGGKFVTVPNKLLDRITLCQTREVNLSSGDRLHLKANRKLKSGGRVTNGELVTVKTVQSDGGIELTDGRVLDKSFREFLPGYAVTSYGSQGKTVDYVLFSDSTIKAATNAQQWYVTISRGRRGVRIFTPDKDQLRENVSRCGHRPLALEMAGDFVPHRRDVLWDHLHGYLFRFGRHAADMFCHLKTTQRKNHQPKQNYERKNTRMLGERSQRSRGQNHISP